ncbi:DUF1109 domain-containing protein [Altererythrobacter arenosus]|uniref:DUF1109 domain-containing protein n=1 Tax=Altererythrobacter arenosus TaxID=3032592 RepID=A0ABY8FM32_9SPHN|nr:DUF1109 domain-containing protein [Altererythrobacter sp. CAU 1644]WFL76076.1 DUF1109 domain-containing protein [Altererythrobacter sp. CAU 1644]
MKRDRDNLIAGLADDLAPVRGFSARDGAVLVTLAVLATVLGVSFFQGLWAGILSGEAEPFFWITNGLLLLLGLASASAVVAMASPHVGARHDAPNWAAAMVGILPVAAIISVIPHGHGPSALMDPVSIHCLTSSLIASTVTGGALLYWLRRGAPVSLEKAGWFTGLAAGALGGVAYGLSCPLTTVTHLGIWHVLPVAITAVIGRLAIPRLVNW